MSKVKFFSDNIYESVEEKIKQAKRIATIIMGNTKPSEQFIMFVYEKLQQEEFIENGPCFPFVPPGPKGKADLHVLYQNKKEEE